MIQNLMISTFLSLKAHKLRVFLTMIGIIIGISSVVTIASLGEGLRQETVKLADSTNSNEIKIQNAMPTTEGNMFFTEETSFTFSRSDMKRVQKINGVASVLPDYGESMGIGGSGEMISSQINYFGQSGSVQLSPYAKDETLAYGRNISPEDANSDVVVLSQDIFDYEISTEDPEKMIGQAMSINGYMYKIIGIKKPYDDEKISFTGDEYLSSMTSVISRASYNELTKAKPIKALKIKLEESADRDMLTQTIIDNLTESYPNEEGVFEEDTFNQQMQQQMETFMTGIVGFLMAITAISLLVGGIGVMNIMYVSVTQRKREIGIRRAIGAKPRNILFQFVLEAGIITLIGGIIGLLSGYGVAIIVGKIMGIAPILTTKSILLSTSVSILTGLFFGIMPAISAAKMDPIKAIYR